MKATFEALVKATFEAFETLVAVFGAGLFSTSVRYSTLFRQPYVRTYVRTYVRSYVHTYIRTYGEQWLDLRIGSHHPVYGNPYQLQSSQLLHKSLNLARRLDSTSSPSGMFTRRAN